MDYLLLILIYCFPLILGGVAIYFYRTFVNKDGYCRDFISGLIALCAAREFLRNFRFRKR